MVLIINKRPTFGTLFHYAHFICDCLYPEIINEIYNKKNVIRLKHYKQTLGNFKETYEDIMKIESIEVNKKQFHSFKQKPIVLKTKEEYHDIQYMEKFRSYIFNRYNINPLIYLNNYPEVLLIKRGGKKILLNNIILKNLNTAHKKAVRRTGAERREIAGIDEINTYLTNKYNEKFRMVLLEDKSFEEQVLLFNNAKLIIMAHGAAMSNMFFCKKDTMIIEITCNTKWPFFDIISTTLELKHTKIEINEPEHIIDIISKL